ncbi:hypothetical protein JCM10207_001877 [Rhodosporidiobolus poonsookiae]
MSALARSLAAEDDHTAHSHLSNGAGLHMGDNGGTGDVGYGTVQRAGSSVPPGALNGAVETLEESRLNGTNGTSSRPVTPPPRTASLASSPGQDSPEHRQPRRPSAASQTSIANGKLDKVPPRSSSVSPAKSRQPAQQRLDEPLPPPPIFAPTSEPSSSPPATGKYLATPVLGEAFPSPSNLSAPFSAAPSSPSPAAGTLAPSNTLSVSSTNSNATSNSSHLPPPPNISPYPQSNASVFSIDPETTATLIQNLYARLDAQGVHGDGWDEGKERSRDGIISREMLQGGETLRPRKGKLVALPSNADEEAKADHVLRRVDRYGFFSQSHPAAVACQHNRLATLSATPFSVLPSLNPKKNAAKPPSPPSPTSDLMSHGGRNHPNRASTVSLLPSTIISPESIALETKRIDKWASMLSVARRDPGGNSQDWVVGGEWWSGRTPGGGGGQSGKYRRLQRRVFKGIPDRWRRAVWGLLMEKMASEVASGKVPGQRGGGRVPSLEELKREYEALLEQPSVQDVQIDLDVPRTISGHVLFHTRYGQGQRALFHVLHAFGLKSEEIGGYCQGMGPIAATLLCYFEPERAYAGLCRLFDQYQLGHIFAPGFPGLVEAFYVQEKLVEVLMPAVHAAFAEHFISTSAYATKWYITLFANSVPFATQLRLWDGLLLEGVDFLVITAVAIIWHFQHDFTSPSSSFESILSRLSSYFFVESDDALLRWIRKTIRTKAIKDKMTAWRKEWQGFVADGTSGSKVT